jgi:predicted ArsR family transcriptional regulator
VDDHSDHSDHGTGQVHAAGRNRQRERVLELVREHDGPVDAADLAARLGLHLTTVRFHLDALCSEGTVERTRIARAGVGRPRTGYLAVRERLDYQSLAGILALELGNTADKRRRRAEAAGRRWAKRTGQRVNVLRHWMVRIALGRGRPLRAKRRWSRRFSRGWVSVRS